MRYIPKQGDVVFVDLNPIKGHEQSGFRTAVVISNNAVSYTHLDVYKRQQ